MRAVFALIAACLCVVSPARAADVVLVHPLTADPFVEEIFHRVNGELRVHGISLEQEPGGPGETSQSSPDALFARTHAQACVFFDWRGDASVVRVWVRSEHAPPALFEAIALERNPDVPTLLAARAVDLLTAALKTKDNTEPRASPPAPPAISRHLDAPSARWALEGDAATWIDPLHFGAAWGPGLVLERLVSPDLRLGVTIIGPLWGARDSNAEASVRLLQGVALAELEALVASAGRLSLGLLGGAGGYFVRAKGTVADGISTVHPGSADRWSFGAAGGLRGTCALSSELSLVLSLRALFLLPRPRVVVGPDSARLSEPALNATLGLRVAF